MTTALPVEDIKESVLNAWADGGCIVSAPPGSGKTTLLPLWLLEKTDQPIFLLIPKRIAVKMAASRLAENLNEPLGKRVGYRLRREQKTSRQTQLTVITYGSFLRLLINDPDSIAGATVIFDEFHERTAEQDFCLALIHQYFEVFDDSIKRIIMSATLTQNTLANYSRLPVTESQGFSHPLEIEYKKLDLFRFENAAPILLNYWQKTNDHLLVFVPGLKEMRAIERALPDGVPILLLHSQLEQLPNLSQLDWTSSTIILATNIAESSLTIPRVKTVIDTGFERHVTINPITSISELKTRRISRASATQRAGRAARLGPGYALRLWSEDEHNQLIEHQPPEILHAELTELYLLSLAWGCKLEDLRWLDTPTSARIEAAKAKLRHWNAIDNQDELTDHGKLMIQIGLEPWLSHIVTVSKAHNCLTAGVILAAQYSLGTDLEYDPFTLDNLGKLNNAVIRESQRIAQRLQHQLLEKFTPFSEQALISALADRLVYQNAKKHCQLISGTAVIFHDNREESTWSIMLQGIRSKNNILISQHIPVSATAVLAELQPQIAIEFTPISNNQMGFKQVKTLGAIRLAESSYSPSSKEKVQAWSEYICQNGEKAFNWTDETRQLKEKWLLASVSIKDWPNWPTAKEWATLSGPFLATIDKLNKLSLKSVIEHALGYQRCQLLIEKYPSQWTAPSKRALALKYSAEHSTMTTQCKLQELFGLESLPKMEEGIQLSIEATAPNGRPVAKITDLSYFWANIYPEIRKELRGRYSKHPWPEDPLTSIATAKTNRQLKHD